MRKLPSSLSVGAAMVVLWACSLMVPEGLRKDWLTEWRGEAWQAGTASHLRLDILRFVSGALPDAICLRQLSDLNAPQKAITPLRCLVRLAAVSAVLIFSAFALPSVRSEFRQADWHTPGDLFLFFLPNSANEATPTISPERFDLWQARARYLTDLGFYQITERDLVLGGVRLRLRLAHSTRNLLKAAGGDFTAPAAVKARNATLILSRRACLPACSARENAPLTGIIGGRRVPVVIAGELRDSGLPGSFDGWLVDDQPFESGTPGYVVGRYAPGTAMNPYFGFSHFEVSESSNSEVAGFAFPVQDRKVNPWATLAFGLGFAVLALPATVPLGFGEKVRASQKPSVRQLFRRSLFMLLKIMLCAAIVGPAAFLIAAALPPTVWRVAAVVRILSSLGAGLYGLRWCIHDQRQRCPVCLKQLTNPAQVGEPSRSFLSWSGTELICNNGHGVLHVPAHATSWFRSQRWLAFDPSWSFLFAEKR